MLCYLSQRVGVAEVVTWAGDKRATERPLWLLAHRITPQNALRPKDFRMGGRGRSLPRSPLSGCQGYPETGVQLSLGFLSQAELPAVERVSLTPLEAVGTGTREPWGGAWPSGLLRWPAL